MKLRVTLFFLMFGIFKLIAGDVNINDTISLDEVIIVSGTKTLLNRNQIPSTVSVVTREELDESSESAILPILSERVPGLFVTERGVTGFGVSTGAAGTVNIRGVGSGNKVLMLFDGQPQWAGVFGHHLPDMYVTSDAERVEIIRGPASLLYGSNAMGGVINVITRRTKEDGVHGRGRLLYGSYNTQKYMINTGIKKNKFNLNLSVNHDRTNGHRDNSAFHITNGYAKLGYDFSENWKATTNLVLAKFKSHNPGTEEKPVFDNWVDALRGTYSFSVENHYEKKSGAFQAFYNWGKHEIDDGWEEGKGPSSYLFNSDDYNAGFAFYESFRLSPDNLVTTGIDFKQWGGKAWNDSINGNRADLVDKSVYEWAAYLLSQQNLTDKLSLNMGIRFEKNEVFGEEWIPQLGIAYQLSPYITMKTSVSKGFRSPNIRELYMFMPANPDLRPEYMNNYDFSYLHRLLGNKLELELTVFFSKGENMIQTVIVDSRPMNVNTGSFINKGFEFAAYYKISSALKINTNYSFLHTDIPIIAAPKHKAFLGGNWKFDKFSLSGNMQFIGDLYTRVGENSLQESYTLLGAKFSFHLNKWVDLFVNGENLTDCKYSINEGFTMPGIVVVGGIDFKF